LRIVGLWIKKFKEGRKPAKGSIPRKQTCTSKSLRGVIGGELAKNPGIAGPARLGVYICQICGLGSPRGILLGKH
jgi:hypothetical protein